MLTRQPTRPAGKFVNPALQKLYDDLVARGSKSLTDALEVGKLIEQTDIADLDTRIARAGQSDVVVVYNNLRAGSEHHLSAFTRRLDGSGTGVGPGSGAGRGPGGCGRWCGRWCRRRRWPGWRARWSRTLVALGGKTQDRMARRQSRLASASGTVARGPSGLTAGVGRSTRRDNTIADVGTKSAKLAVMNLAVTTIVELVGATLFFVVVGLTLSLIYEERDPSTTLAWVLLLALLPGVGVVLYVLFGRNWRLIGATDRKRIAALARGRDALAPVYARYATRASAFLAESSPAIGRLSRAIRSQNGNEPLPCFDPEVFSVGAEKFERLFGDIEAATDHVHLEYFIWRQDELTARVCDLLARKVAEGVEVRVLYDWIGSIASGKRQLKKLAKAGARVQADAAELDRLNYRTTARSPSSTGKSPTPAA